MEQVGSYFAEAHVFHHGASGSKQEEVVKSRSQCTLEVS